MKEQIEAAVELELRETNLKRIELLSDIKTIIRIFLSSTNHVRNREYTYNLVW